MLLQSRNQKPLDRSFPELVDGLLELPAERFALDGEIIIRGEAFETLQLRPSGGVGVEMLAQKHPATLVVFDLIVDPDGRALLKEPFSARRTALERFMKDAGKSHAVQLSHATRSVATARRWLGTAGLDGIMAKRLDLPYRPDERAMAKFKVWKTIDCVVGGLYWQGGRAGIVDSLLLGLYDDAGRLNYVGRARIHNGAAEMGDALKPLIGGKGFTGPSAEP